MSLLNQTGGNKSFLSWFGLIMVVLYISFGLFILTTHYSSNNEPGNKFQVGLGWLLVAYGVFRSFRVYKDFKPKDDLKE